MDLSKDHILEATKSIFESMLRLDVAPAGAVEYGPGEGVRVTASISMTGDWNGSIILECSGALARKLAGAMLMAEFAEVNEDVKDVLGEMTNMIAGNVSRALPGSSALSLPSVVAGSGYSMDILKGEEVINLPLQCKGEILAVSVVRARGGRPGPSES